MFSVTVSKKSKKSEDQTDTGGESGDDEDTIGEEIQVKDFEETKKEKMAKITEALIGIKTGQDERTPEGYFTDSFRADALTISSSYQDLRNYKLKKRYEYRREVAEKCLEKENDIVVIFCNLVKKTLQAGYRNEEGKPVAALYKPLRNMMSFLQNITDFYSPFRTKIVEQTEFMIFLTQKLHEWASPHLNKELKENDNILLQLITGILHNVAQEEENVPELREIGVIEAAKPYLESHVDMRRLSCLAILADLVNEQESQLLQSNSDSIAFLIKCLNTAVAQETRRSNGWSAREIARTIRTVAKNDTNKRTVVTHGALPSLVLLANEPKNAEEQKEAVGALWTLSFDEQNRAEMINNPDSKVIDTLYKCHKAENEEVRKICYKALWTMRNHLKSSEHYKHIGERFYLPKTPRQDATDTHVMISYNWGHQPIVKQICSNLRNNGIKVWMDVDDMQGSTLQAMASAVEKAEIVLVCYSHKYKNSDNCRAEAEYAFQLKKKIVPLKMEKNYKADGWLGFIIGAKLFFDFSGKYLFENKITELIKEVQMSLNTQNGHVAEIAVPEVKVHVAPALQAPPLAATAAPRSTATTTVELGKVKKWTAQHIGKWLDKNKLPRNLLQRLSGIEVAFLHVLVQECPEVFYKTIGEQLGVKDILTMAKLRFALEELDVVMI